MLPPARLPACPPARPPYCASSINTRYTVPNFGFNLRLADYDFSQSSQNNRTRNPKVEWIKRERQCGKRIEDDNWSSACRTVKVADANGASSDSEPVGSSEGARLVYRAKAALAQLKAMSWLNDSLDFICAKTSFTCQKWREVGCHNVRVRTWFRAFSFFCFFFCFFLLKFFFFLEYLILDFFSLFFFFPFVLYIHVLPYRYPRSFPKGG